jgi:hypothetical protein
MSADEPAPARMRGIAKRTCTASAPRSPADLIQRRRTDESLTARIRELTALCQFTDRLQRAESPEENLLWMRFLTRCSAAALQSCSVGANSRQRST